MTPISPLEPLLQSGRARRVLVLGSEPSGALLPSAAKPGEENVDLVLIVPDRGELGREGWLRGAATKAASAVGADGVVYVVMPRRGRRQALVELRRAGLVVERRFMHVSEGAALRYLVPLERSAWRDAFTRLIAARPRSRALLRALARMPAAETLLAILLPTLGLVARRPDARPLADWIFREAGEGRPGPVIVATSWRGAHGGVTLHCFTDGGEQPWAVAKVVSGAGDEGARLERLGSAARQAGARVPTVLAHQRSDERSLVVASVVPGRPAANVLSRSPEKLAAVLGSVTDWLAAWNRATAASASVDQPFVDEHVLSPAAALRDALGPGYEAWLRARCAELVGTEIPVVSAHNDLTMWNVVLDESETIGVLDWETAETSALPLGDFFYAVTDGVLAADRSANRLSAFESCFGAEGSHTAVVASLQQEVAQATQIEAQVADLAFHACWLRHAANEAATGGGGRQFLDIARWLARRVSRVPA